ncbi:MAG: hypothetical protein QOF62_2772 [Pyrinomonadaceae bacterium]|jgi:uncharacterized membrane protein|nr:hypothetical protein [Pyrinomonadaceae bacterium]
MNVQNSQVAKTDGLGTPGSKGGSVDELTRRNVEAVLNLEQAANEQRTPSELIAERIARFCGSIKFVWVHVIWFTGWIVFNLLPGIRHIDPFPFTFLTLVVSLEAIFLSTFILISQNHDTQISERRNHLDLQINLLSEQENTKMIQMLQAIAEKVGVDLSHDSDLEQLGQETQPEKLAEQIEQREEK